MKFNHPVINTLTDEQKKKIEAAGSPEELLALAKEAGYDLSQDQLESVSGGGDWFPCDANTDPCPLKCEIWN